MFSLPLSGEQVRIESAGYVAEIASVGATLRTLRRHDRDLIAGFPAEDLRPAMRGALLLPWPNRVADGAYEFEGQQYQLVMNEQDTRTAAHGLAAWSDFGVTSWSRDRVVLTGHVVPQPGYPWRLGVEVSFIVNEDGLTQEVTVVNECMHRAPVGIGGHPYLLAPPGLSDGGVDDWMLHLNADHVLLGSADRMLPEREVDVAGFEGGRFDFRTSRSLRSVVLNNAYTSLIRADDGTFCVRLEGSGGGVAIEWDARCEWVHVYTADQPTDGVRRMALAVEPMTCPPDALNSGRDLQVLAPGACLSAGWRIHSI